MKKEKLPGNKLRLSGLKLLTVAVLIVALVSALWINFGIRAKAEVSNRTVGLVLDYDEIVRLAAGNPNLTFADMLRLTREAGATGIIVRERLLSEWETSGDIAVFTGAQLRFQLENISRELSRELYGELSGALPGKLPNEVVIESQIIPELLSGILPGTIPEIIQTNTYILTKNESVYLQIMSLLKAKERYPEAFDFPGYFGISVQLHSSERGSLGVGFPLEQLELAAAEGFQIIPRLRNWEPLTPESSAEVFRWVNMIPNLAAIGFNETSLPGGGTKPELQEILAEAIAPLGKPLVSFEFYDQVGLPGLAERLNYQLLRAHAISENEMFKYTEFDETMNRFKLAASERNIRYIYLRFQGLINPGATTKTDLEWIEGIKDGLIAEGLSLGTPKPIENYKVPFAATFLIGVGVIAAGGWLIVLGVESFAKKKWLKPFVIVLILGCFAWGGLMLIAPTLSRKLMSLAAANVLPSLSVILVLISIPRLCERSTTRIAARKMAQSIQQGTTQTVSQDVTQSLVQNATTRSAMLKACITIIVVSLLSLAGAMMSSALLSEPPFLLRLDMFFGVKISHVIPLVIIPIVLWLREEDWKGIATGAVKSSVRVWQLAIAAVLLLGLIVYVMRTGNDSPVAASGIEATMRKLLDRILGVRPRTKEFLIGHPLMLILLYFGYELKRFPLVMVGAIGQVSIINTFAHSHTPLSISLLRTFHGLWIGILIGIVAIIIIKWVGRKVKAIFIDADAEGNIIESS